MKKNKKENIPKIYLCFVYSLIILFIIFLLFFFYNSTYTFYPKKSNIVINSSETYSIELLVKNSKYLDADNYIFESKNEQIAKVDKNGIITPVSSGTTEIIIKSKKGFHTKKISLVVSIGTNDDEVIEAWFSSETYALKKGNTLSLKLITNPSDLELKDITWESSNDSIATVNNGVVKGIKEGEVVITATLNNEVGATCKLIIQDTEIAPKSITLNKDQIVLYPKETEKLISSILPKNATDKTITWASSDESVATVDNGIVTAKRNGTAIITVKTYNGKSSTCKVIVKRSDVLATSVSLNKTSTKISVGQKETLTATINPNNTTDKKVSWISSDDSIATVTNGVVVAKKEGSVVITAKTSNGKTATCKVIVKANDSNIYADTITLNETSVQIDIGQKEILTAIINPENTTDKKVEWTSSDESVATVTNGVVVAKKEGSVVITAKTSNGKTATCKVVVKDPTIYANTISLNKSSTQISIGQKETLTATINPNNTTDKKVNWTSSDESIATVINGVVTAKKNGTVTITAKTSNGKSATCKVIVPSPTNATEVCNYIKLNNISKVSYEDFQKLIDNTDDYYAIKEAHDCANRLKLPVYAKENAIYNIYKTKSGEASIKVKTSTNLNNATIYIHDETGVIGTSKDRNAIYNIVNDEATIGLDSTKLSALKGKIKKNVKTISELAGYGNILVRVVNENKKQFIRYGSNADSGYAQTDVFKVDNNGNVLNDIIWNFNDITSVNIMKIPDETVTFKNGNFVTIATTSNVSANNNYAFRGISVKRSNTIIDNIDHIVVNSSKTKISTIAYTYYGFIEISLASDVTMKNCNLYALKTTNTKPNSTYDFIIGSSANLTIDNVKIPESQLSGLYWGVIATNHIKDITFNNCRLNRIDSHRGVYNLTISNTTIGDRGLSLIGGGKLKISNTSVSGTSEFINLRYDYGSLWNGTIEISDSIFTPSTSSPSLILMKVLFDDNLIHNFGYDLVIPNVKVTNFTIKKSVSKFYIYNNSDTGLLNGNLSNANNYTGGKFKFTIPSSIKYSNIKSNSGIPTIYKYKISF